MTQIIKKVVSCIMAFVIMLSAVFFMQPTMVRAEAVGDFTVTGGTKGTDYEYADNVLTIKTGTAITIANTNPSTATSDRIEVADGVSANITLAGVNIDVSGTENACAFKIADNSMGNVTVTLVDNNILKGGKYCAGLQKNGDVGKLTITGTGSLEAIGGYCGAGIGGSGGDYEDGISSSYITINGSTVVATGSGSASGIGGGGSINGKGGSGSYIEISGGKVTATGGGNASGIGGGGSASGSRGGIGSHIEISGGEIIAKSISNGAGIGGGANSNSSNITISGGMVTATGGENSIFKCYTGAGIGGGYNSGVSNIIISGGSVNATGATAIGYGDNAVPPTLADGTTKVFLYTIDTSSVQNSIVIDGVSYPTTHNGEQKIYPYLSAGFHTILIDGSEKLIYIDENGNITDSVTQNTKGAFEIFGGTENTDYTYFDNVLTIKTETPLMIENTDPNTATTIDRIVVAIDVNANVTLSGVNIDMSSKPDIPAFEIVEGSTGIVTVTLKEDTKNTLKGGNQRAGLQKNGNDGQLFIQGEGFLRATCGYGAAAIGGSIYAPSTNIFIKGGIITAEEGAVPSIGAGLYGGDSNIKVTGGSVKASFGATPTNDNSENVYLFEIANDSGEDITINGTAYPTNHNGEKKIYTYLPAKSLTESNEVTVGVTTTKHYYDTTSSKWLEIVDIPEEDTTTFTYNGSEQTYQIAESDYYTITGNKQTKAGEHTVTIALKYKEKTVWSDGTTDDKEYCFVIGKKAAPVIDDINESYNWGETGQQMVTASGLPDDMGMLGTASCNIIIDDNSILTADSVLYGQGRVRFELSCNTAEKIGSTATIKVTVPSQNYKDITFNVIVTITAKDDPTEPEVTAPSITTQPSNVTVKVGETATFTIVASGTDITYQWMINRNDGNGWVNIASANAASYTISAVDKSCNGFQYKCVVSNSAGNVNSNTVTLTVQAAGGSNLGGGGSYTPSIPQKPTEPTQPQIKDDKGNTGWTAIEKKIEETIKTQTEGGTKESINIDMNGTNTVPKSVLDTVKGKDVTIIFDMGNGISWTVNGKDVTGASSDINFGVKTNTNAIPVDIINKVAGERMSVQMSLEHNGEFGLTAALKLNLEPKNKGMYANLFYYNLKAESGSELEFICADKIDEEGNANLIFNHASDYTIVIDKEPMQVEKQEESTEQEKPSDPITTEVTAPKKGTLLTDSKTKMVYKITKSGINGGTVQFVKTKNIKTKTIAIPDKVTIGGITYKVTSIAAGALKNNKTVTTVTIGKYVTSIGSSAFSNCTKLKKVTIGKSVTTIGSKVFYKCASLTNITIPYKVKKIGNYTFKGCSKLKSITIKTTLLTSETVSKNAFSGFSNSAVVKVQKSKAKAYKELLVKKGLGKKAIFRHI